MKSPPFPMVISPGVFSLPAAQKGHIDPFVAILVIQANKLLRNGLNDDNINGIRVILYKLSKYNGDGWLSRWLGVRKLIAGIRRGIAEGKYVAIIAEKYPGIHCDIGILAMPEPYPVHGCEPFAMNNKI